MDETNQNHDGETEAKPCAPEPLTKDPESGSGLLDGPEKTGPDEGNDFEIGITIEEMRAKNIADESDRPVMEDLSDPLETGAHEGASPESDLSGHDDRSCPDVRIDEPFVVKTEDMPVYTAGSGDKMPVEEEPDTDFLLSAISRLDERVGRLFDLFETKISVDAHKNKVIDNLHDELQTFREGIIKKQFYSFVTDVIKVIDDIRKFKRHYDDMPPTAENMNALVNFLEGIASDIEDLFSWQGVVPFRCDKGSLDTGRQRVINKIECDDPALDRMVAESIRPGYEWDGRVIRPEMVSVFMYVNKDGQEGTLADGQTD